MFTFDLSGFHASDLGIFTPCWDLGDVLWLAQVCLFAAIQEMYLDGIVVKDVAMYTNSMKRSNFQR